MRHPYWNKGRVEAGILRLAKYLNPPIFREWDESCIRVEYEYRKNIPEVKVVEALKAWIDSQWGPPELHAMLWQEVLKAIKEVDEAAMPSIKARQEYYARKLGRAYDHVTEKEKDGGGGVQANGGTS